jgi:hypothetical protein
MNEGYADAGERLAKTCASASNVTASRVTKSAMLMITSHTEKELAALAAARPASRLLATLTMITDSRP